MSFLRVFRQLSPCWYVELEKEGLRLMPGFSLGFSARWLSPPYQGQGRSQVAGAEALRSGPRWFFSLQVCALLPPSTSTFALEGSSAGTRGAPVDFWHVLRQGLWRFQVEVRAASDVLPMQSTSNSYPTRLSYPLGSESPSSFTLISSLGLCHHYPGVGLPHRTGGVCLGSRHV